MPEEAVERRLAAVLAADVVGYSRLMGADELGTLRRLRNYRQELIDPTIAARRGRIVKTAGDGLLVEFASAVDAVACGITVQRAVAARNESEADDKRMVLRIGINIGDIIIESGDIFGDGVNVAARLEGICEPGGLCISRAVRDQVRDKLPIAFDDRGEQTVKNIVRPVRVFGLTPQAIADAPPLPAAAVIVEAAASPRRRRGLWAGIAAAVALVLLAGGVGAWRLAHEWATAPSSASVAPAAATHVAIAVLPLATLGGTPGDDYFADGLTEDVIAALGRFRSLSVIAPAAVFAYKGKHPTPAEIGRDLKVRFIVEGSVLRALDKIRIAIDLTDTEHSEVLWSDKYDAVPKNIFSVQDEITRRIAGALAIKVTDVELARSKAIRPGSMEAYDLVLQGRALTARLTRPENAKARELFDQAIKLDPNYAPAYVGLGRASIDAVTQGWTPDPQASLQQAEGLARKAIELDDLEPEAHALLGTAALYFGEYDRALDEAKRAIHFNGSDAQSYSVLMDALLFRGDLSGAIAAGETLTQFDPDLPAGDALNLALAYVLADRGEDAIRVLQHALDRNSGLLYAHVILATAYAELGRQSDAERQAAEVHRRFPGFLSQQFGSLLRDPKLRGKLAGLLKQAGL